jgi:hypothetical protein
MEPGGTWLLQNRAHAHFNNVYMVCPNVGPVYVHPQMEHPFGRMRTALSHRRPGNAGTHRAQHVRRRDHRHRGPPPVPHDESQLQLDEGLRTEIFRWMYEEPVHPKNLN